MSSSINPRSQFPEFYGNPAIKALAQTSRWTVSGRLGDNAESKNKAPIDMRHLLNAGRVRGAWARDKQCLVDLGELTESLPDAANTAYYLQALTDGLVVIDIEPGCPAEVAANLLALPGAIYTETSMSGRGYHLVTPLPKNFRKHPVASSKKVLREEHGWYEILIEHWVTFTRRPIGSEAVARAQAVDLATSTFSSMEDLYESLAVKAKPTQAVSTEVGTVGVEAPKIPGMGRIIRQTLVQAKPWFKGLDQFNGDHSRFEFSILGTLYRRMVFQMLAVGAERNVEFTPSDEAWLLYLAAKEVLPRRAKHAEQRNGRPFLLDRAAAMVASANTSN